MYVYVNTEAKYVCVPYICKCTMFATYFRITGAKDTYVRVHNPMLVIELLIPCYILLHHCGSYACILIVLESII